MIPIAQINAAPHVALFLDFDGTLAPIVERPQDAHLPDGVREALRNLATDFRFTVAIVSGRELADLQKRVNLSELIYAGNHGLEISGPGLTFHAPAVEATLPPLLDRLRLALAGIPGAEVEDKNLTASVHYRRVAAASWTAVERIVRELVPPDSPYVIHIGKMVFEIRPRVQWNKGAAVLWIVQQLGLAQALAIYIGDDTTDEDAFAVLPDAVTIRVGPPIPSAARYFLPDPPAVHSLLQLLSCSKGSPF